MSDLPHHALLSPFGWAQRFEMVERIGAGAMGQVWRAREIATDRIVALKMIDPARCGDEQILARLEIEGETLTKLRAAGQHEHVVPILDFKVTAEHACLVMEFIPGLNLKKWCSTHQLSLQDRVRFIAQVARASGWFHDLGIVHRDLKPANILVSAVTRQPVIVDFSIAKVEDTLTLTLTNEALGTAPYMAPEQFDRRRGPISPASDVFALGATLYELLTQVHPHPGDFPQIMQRLADEVRPAPPSALNPAIPRDLESIILKALSHRPQDRYTNGTALADDLESFLTGEPVKARPLPLATRLLRRARRKPALTAALAACLVLGGIALWNVQRRASQRERFTLESKLTAAMQDATPWTAADLEAGEAALAVLNTYDPARAAAMRQRLHEDIVHDMESTLSQNHLRDDDFVWLRGTAAWLRPRLPDHAARLEKLITERAGRWQTRAELRPPFAAMQGLFPRSHVHVVDGLLHARQADPSDPVTLPIVQVIASAVSVPMEIDGLFLPPGEAFRQIAIEFNYGTAEVEIYFCKVGHANDSILKNAGYPSPDPKACLLLFHLNKVFQRALLVPDTQLLEKPFRLTLRVEREWAEATLNDQWHLRLDSPFALGSIQPKNSCRLVWTPDIGLKELTLRTRRSDTASPLEQADLLAGQGQWAAARRLYENLLGDPQSGSEADCKIAHCLWAEGDHATALLRWGKIAQSPPSAWRDRSLLQLVILSLLSHDWESTTRYLPLLPEHLPLSTLGQIDSQLSQDLTSFLVVIGMGIAQPRTDPAQVRLITQVYQIMQTPALVLANRLGMVHHFAHQDEQAKDLFQKGLSIRDSFSQHADALIAAANCLDQWCRLVPSEKDNLLFTALGRWSGTFDGRAIGHMEKARRAARKGNIPDALTLIQLARQGMPEKLDNRLYTSLWLLEGMLHRLQGTEDKAQLSWRKGRQTAATVTMRHPLHLFDSILLHSLTRSWDRETAGDVLTTLASRHLSKAERPTAEDAFNQTFLTDPAWLTTFNTALQKERGRKFAEDYALCLDPPRELVQRYYRLLFEHYFLSTAFPKATPEQSTRVRQIVDTLVTEMSMNPRGEMAHLHAYLRAWNDPAAAKTLFESNYPYSPALIESLKWLLQQRHRHPDKGETAKRMEN